MVARTPKPETTHRLLSLDDGRELYKQHYSRPRMAGGVGDTTAKRYRSAFDKFLEFAKKRGISYWNMVNKELLIAYARHLEESEYRPHVTYSPKTIRDDSRRLNRLSGGSSRKVT